MNKQIKEAKCNLKTKDIEKSIQLYLLVQKIVENRQADAFTINCRAWKEWNDVPVPCLPLTFFKEQGIPAACSGDIDALLTMVIFKRAGGLPTFMGNPHKVEKNFALTHCVLPRNMKGLNSDLQPFYLSDYHGERASPTIGTEVPAGTEVTIARLTKNLEKILLTSGTVKDSRDINSKCRNTLLIKNVNCERLLKAVKGIQSHYVISCRANAENVAEIAEKNNIRVSYL
ncbi:hypothetical protein AKJ56_02185 [candidate division MSBL1 archaeon SCGC-AAA382N08]|uniref:L-fucose isomerase C-terminal domain-containing protein n=1 Tax=candidate division MSBL1 archaeon SCGC-AAA382N08 TaxID=1698285 RepID=A0A133VN75_9EURY|nr:hypothetical protein AKJ56_02185 [candidate division MSBL1 archaeon SCGC-AAA382N08]